MIDLRDEGGYSLLEMIITIGLIAIAIGMSTFGLNAVFNSNVNSYANSLASELRIASSREMAVFDKSYTVELDYDTTENRYVAISYVKPLSASESELSRIKFPKGMTISKGGQSLEYLINNSLILEGERKFQFDPSSGALISAAAGTYQLSSVSSSITRDIVVVEVNGRVYVDE